MILNFEMQDETENRYHFVRFSLAHELPLTQHAQPVSFTSEIFPHDSR